jgi:diguanylate cyclase (GGDEF)-like protein
MRRGTAIFFLICLAYPMLFRREAANQDGPTLSDLLDQVQLLNQNRDFFLVAIKTLIFFLKEFSFNISELDADGFKTRLERLYEDLVAENPPRHKEKVLEENKLVILDYIQRESEYFREKDAEFKKIIGLLLEGINQIMGENQEFNGQVYEANLRVEKISQLNDLRKVKDSLSAEVAQVKKLVQQKKSKDDSHIEALSREVSDLRSNLEKVEQASLIDSLTGAHNRLALDTQLNRLAEGYPITGRSFSLLLCDLDNFKSMNDTHGHQVGDRVLKAFVLECKRFFRQEDLIGRYGGEEFAVVLAGTSIKDAVKRAKILCKVIADKQYLLGNEGMDQRISFTVSVGVAGFRPKDTVDALIQRADKALYEAKRQGKNRAVKEA